jgi:hypothetical protein
MAQIVKAQRPQPGATQSSAVAAQQRRRVEMTPDQSDENEVVRADEALTLPETRQRLRYLWRHRNRPD